MAKCRICGTPHKACGPATTVTPVDANIEERETTVGLKRYEVTVEGRHPHTTTLLLSDEDAKRLGVLKEKGGAPAANKARTPRNKAAKPAAKKPAAASSQPVADGASDPDASE